VKHEILDDQPKQVQANLSPINRDEDRERITKLHEAGMSLDDIIRCFSGIPKKFIEETVFALNNPSQKSPISNAKFLCNEKGLDFYHLPSIPEFSNNSNIKTFVVLGETGSGKTTLIDALSNYIMGVQLNDPFRYIVVNETHLKKMKKASESQTDDVTIYQMEGVGGKVRIIDTPGFGDTRGIEMDELITKKLADLFQNKLESLDYILFVVKSTETRLTDRAKWIFHKMQELFGVDMKKNILIMATFCDGGAPNCLQAIQHANIPFSKLFLFNNSAIFTSPFDGTGNGGSQFGMSTQTKRFWAMGMESFKTFMDYLKHSVPVSLSQTKEVIKHREAIELTIKNTQVNIEICQDKITSLRHIMKQIGDIKDIQNKNKNFVIETEEPLVEKQDLPPGQHTTNCLTCNYTCHEVCQIPANEDKKECAAMDPATGNCQQCPSKCYWNKHANLPYIFKFSKVKKQTTLEDLKQNYYDARKAEDAQTQILKGLAQELKCLAQKVLEDAETIRDCMIALEGIALKPHSFEVIQYLKDMITSEVYQKKDGYESRVKQLETMVQRMEKLQKIKNSQNFQDLLPEYEKDIDNYLDSLMKQNQLSIATQPVEKSSCIIF